MDDRDAVRYLKYFTFLSLEEIADIERRGRSDPKARLAQKSLARALTTLVHGEASAEKSEAAAKTLFRTVAGIQPPPSGKLTARSVYAIDTIDTTSLQARFASSPRKLPQRSARRGVREAQTPFETFPVAIGDDIADVLLKSGLVDSRSEAKRLLRQGAVSISGRKVPAERRTLSASDFDEGSAVIAAGPRRRAMLALLAKG